MLMHCAHCCPVAVANGPHLVPCAFGEPDAPFSVTSISMVPLPPRADPRFSPATAVARTTHAAGAVTGVGVELLYQPPFASGLFAPLLTSTVSKVMAVTVVLGMLCTAARCTTTDENRE